MERRGFGSLLFAIFINAMGYTLVFPLLTALFARSAFSPFALGENIAIRHFLLSVAFFLFPLAMFFGAPITSTLSDTFGRKRVLLACMWGACIGYLLMTLGTWMGSLSLLFLGRALSGLMAGSQTIAQAAIADLSNEQNKARHMSRVTLVISVGTVAGPFLGGVLSDRRVGEGLGYWAPFLLTALFAFASALWLRAAFRDTRSGHEVGRPWRSFGRLFRDRQVRIIACIFLLMQLGFILYHQFILLYLGKQYRYVGWELGLFNGWMGVGFVLALTAVAGPLFRRWRVRGVTAVTTLSGGVLLALSAGDPGQWAQWILGCLISGFAVLAMAGLLTLFSNAASLESQGWVMGVTGASNAVARTLTGLATNLLGPLTAAQVLGVAAACMLGAGIWVALWRLDRA